MFPLIRTLLPVTLLSAALPLNAELELPRAEMQPFLETHCISCHGPDKEKGDVRLDTIDWSLGEPHTNDAWSYVLDVLKEGEMPPKKKPQPSPEEKAAFIKQLETHLAVAPTNKPTYAIQRLAETAQEEEPEITPTTPAMESDAYPMRGLAKFIGLTGYTDSIAKHIQYEAAKSQSGAADLATAQPTDIQPLHLKPFIDQHCLHCHGAEKQKGQVRFDTVAWRVTNNDEAQIWQDVLDVLNSGEMPPPEEPRPNNQILLSSMNSLTKDLVTARKRLTDHGGVITMRRLNRREYSNTIQELFGFQLAEHLIPENSESENFDTVGVDQFFSAFHLEQYLELGKMIAAEGFKWSGRKYEDATTKEHQLEIKRNQGMRERIVKGDRLVKMREEGKTWQQMGFKDAGDMKIYFSQLDMKYLRSKEYMELDRVEDGIHLGRYSPFSDQIRLHFSGDPRGTYRIKIHAGLPSKEVPDIRHHLYVKGPEGPEKVLRVKGTLQRPETIEMLKPLKIGAYNRILLEIKENKADIRTNRYLDRINPGGPLASIWVDWVEIEGPFYEQKSNFFGNLINTENNGRKMKSDEMAREFIENFAYEAFRRQQPSADYIDKLHALYQYNRSTGKRYEDAMGEVIGIVLSSPSFLYIQESTKHPDTRQLDDRSLAIRLAYFLWSRPPDEELYLAAQYGKISDPNELKRQVRRMLSDPKADAFYKGFVSQWAELDRFEAISVDQNEFIYFSDGLRVSAYQEVIEFFKLLVKDDLPAHNLIDSDFVVVNAHMAHHYDLDNVYNNTYERVNISSNSPRGGFITQTAFLMMGSNGERTSPVIRGTMILDKILNDPPPPPPPNVPELGSESTRPMTNRQMVELHQSQTVCASCHSRIDPIGFGMENYDTIGKWRHTEKVGTQEARIQQGGRLVSGMRYQDINDLKRLLKTQKHRLAKELVESMLAYGLGRTIEFSDSEYIDSLVNRCSYDDYGMQGMINRIVSSPLFLTK